MHTQEHVDVAVVGAGLAGLIAAVTAAGEGASVLVVDQRTPGGRASVHVDPSGAVLNSGPRALYLGGAGVAVLSQLGIEPTGGTPDTNDSWAWHDGRRHRLPGTPWQLLSSPMLGVAEKLRVGRLLGGLQRIDPDRLVGRTVGQWRRDARLDRTAASLVDAVVRLATYTDAPDELDAGAAVAQLQLALGDGVRYLDGGWGQLVDALTSLAAERGVTVERGRVGPIRAGSDGSDGDDGTAWQLRVGDRDVRAGAVVLAVGGPDAAAALSPVSIDTSGLGPPATAACLELVLRRRPEVPILLGLDAPVYLSVHSPPARLAADGLVVVHAMRYGSRSPGPDRDAVWSLARAAGVRDADVVAQRFLPRMTVTGGIPVARAGGLGGRPPVRLADRLFLAGDWVGDTGLIGDAAMHSGSTAGRLAAATRDRSVPQSAGISPETAGQKRW